ncbi:sensor histidine kinase [Streptomyces sp. GS7]|uniref:sensor histidine kinase n=1 Tax=Streptomyces sp. GS7 TaxID=2692234 RepID=UPI001F3B65F8|nr:histidine kinase [Streptomyces sp. GS7]
MDHGAALRRPRRRRWWCGAAALSMLAPAVVAPPAGSVPAVMAALALVAAIAAWPAGRVSLAHAAGGTALASLAADLAYGGAPGLVLLWAPFESVALLVLLYRAIRRLPRPRAAVLVGAAAVALPLRFTLHAAQTGPKESVVMVALALFPAAGAAGTGLYLRSLDTRRAHAVALARREQRLELARDLHDFVAHEVTGIVLEAQAAQLDGGGAGGDRALLERIEQAGLRALDSMDRTVQTLRAAGDRAPLEPPPTRHHGLADLPELVARFAAMTPARVDVRIGAGEGTEPAGDLSREAEDTAYRVVLEALTNVRRHAPAATRVAVTAGRSPDGGLRISVVDNAVGPHGTPAATREGGGTGLAALAERVTALGGVLEAGPVGEEEGAGPGPGPGWRVSCLLPPAERR